MLHSCHVLLSAKLRWEGAAGAIEINATEYALHQCHWHSPSEHTINGRRGQGCCSRDHVQDWKTRFFPLINYFASITDIHEAESVVGVIDPRHIKIGSRKYYRCIGSLTVSPCTENGVWSFVRKVSLIITPFSQEL